MASAQPLLDVEGREDHVVSILDDKKFEGLLKSLSPEKQQALKLAAGGAAGSDEKASPMTIIALEWPDFLIIPAKALMFVLSLYLLPHNEHGAIMAIFPLAGLCFSAYITMDLAKQLKQNEMTTDEVIGIFQTSRDSIAKTAVTVMMMITAVGLSTFFKLKVSGIAAGCVQLLDTMQSSKAASSLKAERRERKKLHDKAEKAEKLKAVLEEENMKLENDRRLAQEKAEKAAKELQYLKNSKIKDSANIAAIAAKEAELQRLKEDSDKTQREAAKAREELKWLNEHSAKLEAKLEAESKSKDAKPQQAYLVENRELAAHTEGLTARKSKNMNDRDEGNIADWNTIVYGVDAGGGWVKVNDVFLPKKIDGATVLKLQQERDLQVRQQVLAEELALKKQNEMAEQLRQQEEQAAKKQNEAAEQLRKQQEQAAKKQNEAAQQLRKQQEQAAKKQNEMAEQLRKQADKVAELQELERQHQLNNLALADRIDGLQRQSAEQDQRVAQMGEQLGHLSPRLDKLSQDHEESVVALDTEAQRLEGMLHGPAPSVEADMQKISKDMEAFRGRLHGLSQAQTQDQHNVHEVDMLQKEFCQRVNDEMALLTGKVDGVTDTVNQLELAQELRQLDEAGEPESDRLHTAAWQGLERAIAALVAAGFALDARGGCTALSTRGTPLHVAAAGGQAGAARALLRLAPSPAALVAALDDCGFTALEVANQSAILGEDGYEGLSEKDKQEKLAAVLAVLREFAEDIFYVCKKALESLKEKLKAGEEVSQELVNELTFPEKLADDEIMVPVDMRGVGEEFDDVESMVEKLGPKGTAEAFVKARDYFEANKDKEPEDERPQPMTAAEWKKVLEEDFDEGEEEEDLLEDEEEFEEGEEGDSDGAGDAEEAEEPAAKKAKTE